MTPPVPIFAGRVDAKGNLTLDESPRFRRWLSRLAGERVGLTVRKHQSKRSDRQNRLLWRWITMLADALGYEPQERERLHYDLLAVRFGMEQRPSGLVLPIRTSSELTTAEMAEYLTWLQRYAAVELHVNLPSPDDLDLDAYDEGAA